jgi:hypothetical protein
MCAVPTKPSWMALLAIPSPYAPLELQLGPIGTVSESAQLLLGKATLPALAFDLEEARRSAGSNFSGAGFAVAHGTILARWRGTLP